MRVGLLMEPSIYLIPNDFLKQISKGGEILSAYCVCTEYKFIQGPFKLGPVLKISGIRCIPKTCNNIEAD